MVKWGKERYVGTETGNYQVVGGPHSGGGSVRRDRL